MSESKQNKWFEKIPPPEPIEDISSLGLTQEMLKEALADYYDCKKKIDESSSRSSNKRN